MLCQEPNIQPYTITPRVPNDFLKQQLQLETEHGNTSNVWQHNDADAYIQHVI